MRKTSEPQLWTRNRLGCYLPIPRGHESSPGVWCRDGYIPPTSMVLHLGDPQLSLFVTLVSTTADHHLPAVLGAGQRALWEMTPLPLPPSTPLLIVYIAVC